MSDEAAAPGPESAVSEGQGVTIERIVELLRKGHIKVEGLMPNSSNYTFLVTVKQQDVQCLAIYKPQKGERPLWDFPRGTLCLREYATFVVSMALGWIFVPPTVLRQGPHGIGAIQLFVDAVPDQNFFTLREQYAHTFQRMCAFDYVVNNADRKGGHCLIGSDERIWGIDHGITFSADFKLRTVIWDWAGEPLPSDIVADLSSLQQQLTPESNVTTVLSRLLRPNEMSALRQRVDALLQSSTFPEPDPDLPNIPWPLI